MKIYEVIEAYTDEDRYEHRISKGLYRTKEAAEDAMHRFVDQETDRLHCIMDLNRWGVDRHFGAFDDTELPYGILYIVDYDDDMDEESCRIYVQERELE